MGRHAAYWQPLVDSGRMVVFGPVLDSTGSWGLGVVEADDEDELRAFCRGKLARYKVPKYIRFVSEFPQTVTGKIQKFEIREAMIQELGLDQAAKREMA